MSVNRRNARIKEKEATNTSKLDCIICSTITRKTMNKSMLSSTLNANRTGYAVAYSAKVLVRSSWPAAVMTDPNSVYVGGLAYDVCEELVRSTFEEFGEVVSVKIVVDLDGHSRGYGFVTFTTPEAASNAIYEMDGQIMAGRSIKVNEVTSKIGYREPYRRDTDSRRGRHSPRRKRSSNHWSHRRDRDRSRSRTRSASGSRDHRHEKKKSSTKEIISDNTRLKEELIKALEVQRERRNQVTTLESELERACHMIEELQTKEKKLEASLATLSAAALQHADFMRKVQRAYLGLKECKERLKSAEHDFEVVMDASVALDPLDACNGDI